MINHITPMLLFISIGFSQKEYDIKNLIKQEYLYIGNFNDNSLNGIVYKILGDQKVILGKLKNGKKDGYGIVTLNTGSTWEGSFKDGLRHGKGYANFKSANNFIPSGKDLIECRDEFVNGRQVGDLEMVYEDGATTIIPLNEFTTFKDTYYTSSQQELEECRDFGELCVQ